MFEFLAQTDTMTISDYITEFMTVFTSPEVLAILGFVISVMGAGSLFRKLSRSAG